MPTEIVFPSVRPALAAVQFAPVDVARGVAMDQGEQRRLPLYTTVPQNATAQWVLFQADFDAFWDWYEDDLEAGERQFDVQLERQGGPGSLLGNPRLQWWTAQFSEPPRHEALSGGRYRITGNLLVYGPAFDERFAPAITAGGAEGDRGGAVFGPTPTRAGGVDGDSGRWLQFVTSGIRAAGPDGDGGGWAILSEPISAGATDGDAGAWTFITEPITAAGAEGDDGGWEAPEPTSFRYWAFTAFVVFGDFFETSEVQMLEGGVVRTAGITPTASSPPDSGTLASLTDGDLSTASVVWDSGIAGNLRLEFDLGALREIDGVKVSRFDQNDRFPIIVYVEKSVDGMTWLEGGFTALVEPGTDYTLSAEGSL